jgi:hypothetical protein
MRGKSSRLELLLYSAGMHRPCGHVLLDQQTKKSRRENATRSHVLTRDVMFDTSSTHQQQRLCFCNHDRHWSASATTTASATYRQMGRAQTMWWSFGLWYVYFFIICSFSTNVFVSVSRSGPVWFLLPFLARPEPNRLRDVPGSSKNRSKAVYVKNDNP